MEIGLDPKNSPGEHRPASRSVIQIIIPAVAQRTDPRASLTHSINKSKLTILKLVYYYSLLIGLFDLPVREEMICG